MMDTAINSMGENVKKAICGKDEFKLAIGYQHGDIGLAFRIWSCMYNNRYVISYIIVDLGIPGR